MKPEGTKVIIKNVSLNYVAILAPKAGPSGGEPKYSVQMRMKKDAPETATNLAAIKTAMVNAYNEGKASKWGGKNPSWDECKAIIHDGDKAAEKNGDESYKGCWVLSANSKTKPGCIDKSGLDLTQPGHEDKIYSGMVAHVSVKFFAFSGAKKGIACGLNNILKVADGEYVGGRSSAQADFAEEINEPAPASESPENGTAVQVDDDPNGPF